MAVTNLAGHARAKSAIKKAPLNREEVLTDLIEQYYSLNTEKRALERAQKELQGQIAEMLPIPADEREVIFVAGELEATHYWPTLRSITPRDLYQYDRELVWRLCSVPLGAAEQALPPEVFHDLVTVRPSDVPQLRIRKRVEKDEIK